MRLKWLHESSGNRILKKLVLRRGSGSCLANGKLLSSTRIWAFVHAGSCVHDLALV